MSPLPAVPTVSHFSYIVFYLYTGVKLMVKIVSQETIFPGEKLINIPAFRKKLCPLCRQYPL